MSKVDIQEVRLFFMEEKAAGYLESWFIANELSAGWTMPDDWMPLFGEMSAKYLAKRGGKPSARAVGKVAWGKAHRGELEVMILTAKVFGKNN